VAARIASPPAANLNPAFWSFIFGPSPGTLNIHTHTPQKKFHEKCPGCGIRPVARPAL